MRNGRGAFAVTAVAAATALSASLSGCGGAGVAAPAVSADTTIEMITAGQDSFYLTMECGAVVEARRLGINLTVAGPAHDTTADQLPLVQGVIVGNPDALIISPATDATSSLTAAGPGGGSSLTQALMRPCPAAADGGSRHHPKSWVSRLPSPEGGRRRSGRSRGTRLPGRSAGGRRARRCLPSGPPAGW